MSWRWLFIVVLCCLSILPLVAKNTRATIDNCSLFADGVQLSIHRPNDGVFWDSTGDEYIIHFKGEHPPCLVNGSEERTFKIGRHQTSDLCLPNPKAEYGHPYRYKISWVNPKNHKSVACNDPVVIVNDGRTHANPSGSSEPASVPRMTHLSGEPYENNINADCSVNISPANLSQADGTQMKWVDDADTFTISFPTPAQGEDYPCSATAGGPGQATFNVNDICYVNPKATTKNGYTYTVNRPDGKCQAQMATINITD